MRPERGMVTAELACATVLVAGAIGVAMAATVAVVQWAGCQQTAVEVARQVARGDAVATARASGDAPRGAMVEVTRADGRSVVRVTLTAFIGPVSIPLEASAVVIDEA